MYLIEQKSRLSIEFNFIWVLFPILVDSLNLIYYNDKIHYQDKFTIMMLKLCYFYHNSD